MLSKYVNNFSFEKSGLHFSVASNFLVIRPTCVAKICLTYQVASAYFNIEIDAYSYICSVVTNFSLFQSIIDVLEFILFFCLLI